MRMTKTSDYRIYFDDVRVDPYILNWSSTLSLTAGETSASITMFKAPAMANWKAYLTQVRIFAKNVFTGKYTMVFEGEITDRTWEENRGDSGRITFGVQGFLHWLNTPLAMITNNNESMERLQKFQYAAQGIAYSSEDFAKTVSEVEMKNKNIEEMILFLFKQLNKGYYEQVKDNSAFGWANMERRMKVLTDIDKSYREIGYLSYLKVEQNTKIDTFLAYLSEILSEMMLEFFQARDGSIYVKNAYWGEPILKNHVLDESIVDSISGLDQWTAEPTRVLAMGARSDYTNTDSNPNAATNEFANRSLDMPLALYLSDPQDPNAYFDLRTQGLFESTGLNLNDIKNTSDQFAVTNDWYDNLSQLPITGKFHEWRDDGKGGRRKHRGVDLRMAHGTLLKSVGGPGRVFTVDYQATGAGHYVVVRQVINNKSYDFKYFHMSDISVSKGQEILSGQVIGRSGGDPDKEPRGEAGSSRGAHLHFEIWDVSANAEMDPTSFLKNVKSDIRKQLSVQSTAGGRGYQDGYTSSMLANTYNFVTTINTCAANLNIDKHLARAYVSRVYQSIVIDTQKKKDLFQKTSFLTQVLSPLQEVYASIVQNPNQAISYLTKAFKNTGVTLNTIDVRDMFNIPTNPNNPKTIEYKVSADSSANDVWAMYKTLLQDYKIQTGSVVSKTTGQVVAASKKYDAYATIDKFKTNNKYDYTKDSHLSEVKTKIESTISQIERKQRFHQAKNDSNIQSDWFQFEATAYTAFCEAIGGYKRCTGKTAAGIDVSDESQRYPIIAVDKSIIPMYTVVEIRSESLPGGGGFYQAVDTGGMIKGRHIDILMQTKEQAKEFGRKTISLRVVEPPKGVQYYDKKTKSFKTSSIKPDRLNQLVYPFPSEGESYRVAIQNNDKIDPNLLAALIRNVSNFNPKYESVFAVNQQTFFGITGYPKWAMDAINESTDLNLTKQQFFNPQFAIAQTATLLGTLSNEFVGRLTFALAVYFSGKREEVTLILQQASLAFRSASYTPKDSKDRSYNRSGSSVYLVAKPELEKLMPGYGLTSRIESILDAYVSVMNVTSVQGDLHYDSSAGNRPTAFSSYAFFHPEGIVDPDGVRDGGGLTVPISEEERRYKMNLRVVVQSLLRYDRRTDSGQNVQEMVNNLVEKYAKYMMQLFRAQAHTSSISLMTCLPFLNPGFNAWIEPSRIDVVGYITKVTHQASYGRGCYTNVQVEFIRPSAGYGDVIRGVFIGVNNADVADFGEVIQPNLDDVNAFRETVKSWNASKNGVAVDSFSDVDLQKLYAAPIKANSTFLNEWNLEYTAEEIDAKIKVMYRDLGSDSVIYERKTELKSIIDESESFFMQKLFLEYTHA